MRRRSLALAMIELSLLMALLPSSAAAQISPERLEVVRSRVNQPKACLGRIPMRQRRVLSADALNLIQLSENWDKIESVHKTLGFGCSDALRADRPASSECGRHFCRARFQSGD